MPPLSCRFDPQQMSVWSNRTGIHFFTDDAQRDEAYLRAKLFLLEQMRVLLGEGWEQVHRDDSDEVLFNIHKPNTAPRGAPQRPSQGKKSINLILPLTFNSFLDTSKAEPWRTMFGNPGLFKAENQNNANTSHDLYIGSSRALANIFYLLQVLAPGMLVIHHEYQLRDEKVNVSRVLPRASWIQRNNRVFSMEVIGSRDAFLAAAQDRSIAFHEERTPRQRRNSRPSRSTTNTSRYRNSGNNYISRVAEVFDGTDYEWTMCDKDCGWCGRPGDHGGY